MYGIYTGIFLPTCIYPGPIKGPVPNAKKYNVCIFPNFDEKSPKSEKKISQFRKCIAKNSKAYIVWILPALTTSKYAKRKEEINCNKIQVQVKISTKK